MPCGPLWEALFQTISGNIQIKNFGGSAKDGDIGEITKEVTIGAVPEEARAANVIAEKCPVQGTLTHEIKIRSILTLNPCSKQSNTSR
jgi:hypothetical protein